MSWWTNLRDKMENAFKSAADPVISEAAVIIKAEEAELISWAHALLAKITPAIRAAVKDAVFAAVTTPGDGSARAAAALAAVIADLTAQDIPHDVNAIKGAIEVEVANMKQIAVDTIKHTV